MSKPHIVILGIICNIVLIYCTYQIGVNNGWKKAMENISFRFAEFDRNNAATIQYACTLDWVE